MEICASGNNKGKNKLQQDLDSNMVSNDENQNLESTMQDDDQVDLEAAEKQRAKIREDFVLTCAGDDEEEEEENMDDQQEQQEE